MLRQFFFVLIFLLCCLYMTAGANAAPGCKAGQAYQCEYIAVLWTDGNMLKAVNLMATCRGSGRIGILAVPTFSAASSKSEWTTLSDLYAENGTVGVLGGIASLTGLPVKKYILIPQRGLEKMSLRLGKINVLERSTTLLSVFEGTYVDGPVDLQIEMRALARSVINPPVLARLPELMYIAASEFKTNVNFVEIAGIYGCVLAGGPEIIKKDRLPGTFLYIGEKKVWLTDSQECRAVISILFN